MTDKKYYLLQTAEDVDTHITDEEIDEALAWFNDEPKMPAEEFMDRLFSKYGGPKFKGEEYDEVDLDQMDNDAARRLMSRARRMRKERVS